VCGGAGFIGGHLTESLLVRGDDVVVVDSLNEYYDSTMKKHTLSLLREVGSLPSNGNFDFKRVDLTDNLSLSRVFDCSIKFDVVVHLAAQAGVRYSIDNPIDVVKQNVLATVQLLELCKIHNVGHVVVASSSSVYGKSSSGVSPFSEDQRCDDPASHYAASKRSTELFARSYYNAWGLNITILRFFTVYGPRGRPDMACFKFIDRISKGLPIEIFGNGTAIREFTYVSDVVRGITLAVDKPRGFQIINIGGGLTYSINELVETIEKHIGKKASILYKEFQRGDVPITCADQTISKEVLGFEPAVSLDDGISQTVDWYRVWWKTNNDEIESDEASTEESTSGNYRCRVYDSPSSASDCQMY